MDKDRIVELERQARVREALDRSASLGRPVGAGGLAGPSGDGAASGHADPKGVVREGPLVLQGDVYTLLGTPLRTGDTIEVYTNAANGWLRGRFEWTGRPEDVPRLAVNVWDPDGKKDEDGLPPWVGTFEGPIPRKAVCRRS